MRALGRDPETPDVLGERDLNRLVVLCHQQAAPLEDEPVRGGCGRRLLFIGENELVKRRRIHNK